MDRLEQLTPIGLQDYIAGASAYVRQHADLDVGKKKAAQIRLSGALARVLLSDVGRAVPGLTTRGHAGERKVAGALRTVNADVSERHELDGLRLAVEIKPVNLAGRSSDMESLRRYPNICRQHPPEVPIRSGWWCASSAHARGEAQWQEVDGPSN